MKRISILLVGLLFSEILVAFNPRYHTNWRVTGTYMGEFLSLSSACATYYKKYYYDKAFPTWHKAHPERPYPKLIDKGNHIHYQYGAYILGQCNYDMFDGAKWYRDQAIQFDKYIILPKENGKSSCSAPSTTPSVGKPIRISTGNMYHIDTDISGPIQILRTYNSNIGFWSHNFSTRLLITEKQIGLQIHDGKYYQFKLVNSEWVSDPDVFHQLQSSEEYGANWIVIFSDTSQAWFDEKGRILKQKWLSGKTYNYRYEASKTIVSDGKGNKLILTYNDQRQLIEAKNDNNYQVNYQYDEKGRLVAVAYPDDKTRSFHFENAQFPNHLTGVTNRQGVRSLTWNYDDQGRATVSEIANGKERYNLEYGNNQTTVTNPLGKKTTYYFKNYHGVNYVVKVEGHASANCAAANKDYEYFDNGLLKSKTDWQGVKTTYQYNDRGLTTEKVEAAGTPQARTTETQWHDTFSLPVKVIEPGKTTTYEYNGKGQLTSQGQESTK